MSQSEVVRAENVDDIITELRRRKPQLWYAVIPESDSPTLLKVPAREQRLKTMQSTVGGLIQWVPLPKPYDAYGLVVDEESVYKYSVNERASALFGQFVYGHVIHGPVMVVPN